MTRIGKKICSFRTPKTPTLSILQDYMEISLKARKNGKYKNARKGKMKTAGSRCLNTAYFLNALNVNAG